MAKHQFTGSDIRKNLPRGGLKKLCTEFDKSNTWIRRVLDGKEIGYPEIIVRAKEITSLHKEALRIKKQQNQILFAE